MKSIVQTPPVILYYLLNSAQFLEINTVLYLSLDNAHLVMDHLIKVLPSIPSISCFSLSNSFPIPKYKSTLELLCNFTT